MVIEAFGEAFRLFASTQHNGITLTDGFASIYLASLGGLRLVPDEVEFGLYNGVVVPESPDGVYAEVRDYLESNNAFVKVLELEESKRFVPVEDVEVTDPVVVRIARASRSIRRSAAVLALACELTAPVNTKFIHVSKMVERRFGPMFSDSNFIHSVELLADLISPDSPRSPVSIVSEWHESNVEDYARTVFGKYYT